MKFRKLIALMLSVFVMAAMAVVPSFAATDVSSWLEKNVTVGVDDAANINARNTTGTRTLKRSTRPSATLRKRTPSPDRAASVSRRAS